MKKFSRHEIDWLFAPGPVRQNALIIGVVFLFLASASYYWFFPVIERVKNDAAVSQRALVEGSVGLLELFFDLTFETLEEFGEQHMVDVATHHKFHEAFFRARKDFISIVAFDADGNLTEPVVARESANSVFSGVGSVNETAFFRETIRGEKYISPVFFGEKGPTLQIAVPIMRDKNIVGVVAAEINFSLVREAVDKIAINFGKVYIVDERGTIVSDPDPKRSRSGESLLYRGVVESVTRGRQNDAWGAYENENRQSVLAYSIRMPRTGWGIVVEQAADEVLKQRNQSMLAASVFAGGGFILLALIFVSSMRLLKALANTERERQEKERVIEYLLDGVIEYTGENKILGINPAAREFLNIKGELPQELYILESASPLRGFERLWGVFFPRRGAAGGQGGSYEVALAEGKDRLRVITVYIKGIGPLWEQRYLKILHKTNVNE